MRRLAILDFCAVCAAMSIAPPAWADAMTLSCAYDRYDPNGTKIGSGVDHITIDFDRQQWMLVRNPKILYHLYGFDNDRISLTFRDREPGEAYDAIDRKAGAYQIYHLSSDPCRFRAKNGACTKERLVPPPTKKFRVEEYGGNWEARRTLRPE